MNKFKTLAAVALAVTASACQQVEEMEGNKELSFKVGFDVGKSVISRAALDEYIGAIQVFDYVDGELAGQVTQTSDEDGFGTVKLDAEYGTHEYVFVGHNSVTCSYDHSKTELTFDKIQDTFTAVQTLTVDLDTEESQAVQLERQVAGVKLVMLDPVPSNAASIELTVNGYSAGLNPKTGAGTAGIEHVREWEYSTSHIGVTNSSYLFYTFLPGDEHTVDITIRVKGTDGKYIASHTIEDISVEKNRMTIISGYLLSAELTASFTVDAEWDEDIEVSI